MELLVLTEPEKLFNLLSKWSDQSRIIGCDAELLYVDGIGGFNPLDYPIPSHLLRNRVADQQSTHWMPYYISSDKLEIRYINISEDDKDFRSRIILRVRTLEVITYCGSTTIYMI